MLSRLNKLTSEYVSLIILSGILIGFLSDIFGKIGNTTLAVILFLELFLACFTIKVDDLKAIKLKTVSLFFVLRFIAFAILLYYLALPFSAYLAATLLLLTLLPAGVSSPGFASLFKANVALTLAIVLVSSLLAPLYIPFIIKHIAGNNISINALEMLLTILLIVVLPIIVHLPFRKSKTIHNFMVEFNPLLLMPLVWITIVVPISRFRNQIFESLSYSILGIIGFLVLYGLYVVFGILVAKKYSATCQRSYATASCIHNITLGVVVSLIYLPNQVSSLVILANIALLILISFLDKLAPKENR